MFGEYNFNCFNVLLIEFDWIVGVGVCYIIFFNIDCWCIEDVVCV